LTQQDLEDIRRRLTAIEERTAIEELTALYAWHAANADVQALNALFTDDGCFTTDEDGPKRKGAELIGYYGPRMAPNYAVPMVSNHIIRINGDEATCSCKMHTPWFHQDRRGFCGHYKDRLRKVNGEWRFVERHWIFHSPPASAD
jgi:hypothetical protein